MEILRGADYAIISSEASHISRRELLEGDHGVLSRLTWTGESSSALLEMALSSSVVSTVALGWQGPDVGLNHQRGHFQRNQQICREVLLGHY